MISFFICLSCLQASQMYWILLYVLVVEGHFAMKVVVTCFSVVQFMTWKSSSHAKHFIKSVPASFLHLIQTPDESKHARLIDVSSSSVGPGFFSISPQERSRKARLTVYELCWDSMQIHKPLVPVVPVFISPTSPGGAPGEPTHSISRRGAEQLPWVPLPM